MKRRDFLRTSGAAAGVAGLGGVTAVPGLLPSRVAAPGRSGSPPPGRAVPAVPARDRLRRRPGRVPPRLRLDSNENALGISPRAKRAIRDGIEGAFRYPTDARDGLIEALAERHGVDVDAIVLGNGSTDILRMTVQALAWPDTPLVAADPTFEATAWYAEPFPYRRLKIPLTQGDLAHDLEAMRRAASGVEAAVGGNGRRPPSGVAGADPAGAAASAEAASGAVAVAAPLPRPGEATARALVYVCNPNNPTGTLTPSTAVEAWIEEAPEDVFFLVDEAYFEYVDDPSYRSAIPLIAGKPNVLVARTFSKVHGMAGLRLGYGVAHPDTARRIARLRGHDNANELALRAALASLRDEGHVAESLEENRRARAVLHEVLDELDLEYLPSHTNFVMHRVSGDLETYIDRMEEVGVWVGRPFPPMEGWNRLSLGRPEEMEAFADILRDFRRKGWV